MLCATVAAADVLPAARAQRMVEQALSRHPEVAHVVMHVTPPHRPDSDNVIIASSIGRIGKRADDDDLRIMHSGVAETVIARNGDRFNVSLPMLDRAGRTIGVLAVGFSYQSGNDQQALQQMAVRLRDELRRQIISASWLFSQ